MLQRNDIWISRTSFIALKCECYVKYGGGHLSILCVSGIEWLVGKVLRLIHTYERTWTLNSGMRNRTMHTHTHAHSTAEINAENAMPNDKSHSKPKCMQSEMLLRLNSSYFKNNIIKATFSMGRKKNAFKCKTGFGLPKQMNQLNKWRDKQIDRPNCCR